ncbi:PIN domain-containing protein [Rubrobacter aplysinae]|uniref:PIN domain-containing protein n=1 Tax=Rubrobacter aplysinae TaxID=909625 RepID=UPI00064BDF3A|nr:PIN domain-containing protein [Rubrobacter aplysinae]
MSPRYLLDSNILVYTLDAREPDKREWAKETIRRAALGGSAALPAQGLSEFSNVCLKKLEPALEPREIQQEIERLQVAFPVIPLTAPVIMEALRGVEEYRFSYYDAQIWAAARLAQIPVILSEDFNPGSTLEGVSFVNPLDSVFDPTALE